MSDLPPFTRLAHGITCIDTLQERPNMACCYLLERGNDLAFIETGTTPGVPRLLALLTSLGLARERVRYVIVTHVHLDHAGGAGALMAALPAATLVVHQRGARHLIDPAKLIAGATAVYGSAHMQEMYGDIVPVPEARVRVAGDGEKLPFGEGQLLFIDTPGHARHHFSIWDDVSQGFFTGDSFGICYPEFTDAAHGAWMLPTSTPVQFDPAAWLATLERYGSFAPQRMFLTHFGVVEDVPRLAADLRHGIGRFVEIAAQLKAAPQRHQQLKAALFAEAKAELRARSNAFDDERMMHLLGVDLELNAQGLAVWLDAA